jgi:hypothetical protein
MFPRNGTIMRVAVLLLLSLVVGSSNYARSFVRRTKNVFTYDIS